MGCQDWPGALASEICLVPVPQARCSHSAGVWRVWRAWRRPGREGQAAGCRLPALESCPECLQEGEGSSGA